jgi:hypothetical protein
LVDNLLPDGGAEGRQSIRVNLFMAATLHASGFEIAVRIRDLSAAGAQVECSQLPEVGSSMTLTRGRFTVQGHVAWCTGRRCGLKFSSNISIQDWMANPVNREQQRVDHIVTAVKAGAVPLVSTATQATAPADGAAGDLERVSLILGSLGDALASDPEIIARHGISLQNLDIVIQTLAAIAETMQSGASVDAEKIVRLNELRTSCAEVLRGVG